MGVGLVPGASQGEWTIEGEGLARATEREWLVTNALGGYALGSIAGTPTRRYHGLLVAAMSAPVERVSCLSAIDDTVVIDVGSPNERRVRLTRFQFERDQGPPDGPETLVRFERDAFGARWFHTIRDGTREVRVEKLVHLFDHRNAARVWYAVQSGGVPVRLELRPLVRLMDHHELSVGPDAREGVQTRAIDGGCVVLRGSAGIHLASRDSLFTEQPLWWEGVRSQRDLERGQGSLEDLFSPGVFEWTTIPAAGTSAVSLDASCDANIEKSAIDDAAQVERRVGDHIRRAIRAGGGDEIADADKQTIARLARAGDQFVVERHEAGARGTSIIAGYPWFSDWGRDAMIALPGLLLTTGRHDEARSLLETFARHRRNGLIPNRFEDSTGRAAYNTADASLLFIKAACEWSEASGEALGGEILDACVEIVEAYASGTDYDIHLDSDGLIAAGDQTTQLTWMDAARDGTVFTPRHGKAIEINALWHHGLLALAERIGRGARGLALPEMAGACRETIEAKFFNEAGGYLFDRLGPDGAGGWEPVDELRPNQLFAIALEHAPVIGPRAERALDAIERSLLTIAGVRTLAPDAPGYRGRYEGSMRDRDAAYHNGTAWPWLLGPYADAVLRVRGRTPESFATIRQAIAPILASMGEGCVGQIGEVFDGDGTPGHPARESGCVAQAWSVAEMLRVMVTIARG